MNVTACRHRLQNLVGYPRLAHPGLVLQRLLQDQADPKAAPALLRAARGAQTHAHAVYRAAFNRRKDYFEALKQPPNPIAVADFPLGTPQGGRLIIGLGNESPLETGLSLHHTYGVPVIPGSAIKGLAAHFLLTIGRPSLQSVIFGDTEDAGYVTFHDAWLEPDSLTRKDQDEGLQLDVMTPHHSKYYERKRYQIQGQAVAGGPQNGDPIPPTDFDNPIPIPFLSVRGIFRFVLTCADTSQNGAQWLKWTKQLVCEALAQWGIGGKTSSGYGRLVSLGSAPISSSFSPEAVGLPPPGTVVVATLLKHKHGQPWRASTALRTGDRSGPIVNGDPPSAAEGNVIKLVVDYIDDKAIKFRFSP